jgi:acetoin utilization deacetylase AcuC-like enzyme
MYCFYSDTFVLPLPPGHRFPMQKYAMLREQIVAAGIVPPERLRIPEPAGDVELGRAHTPAYIEQVVRGLLDDQAVRRIGFPWSPQLAERSRRSTGATIAACRAALDDGVAVNLAGGTHHAFSEHGEGFCVFNDSVVAARAMQAEGLARRVLIIDCDVHQGNGTARICAGDESITTFSIHGARNYPFRKEQSDIDIALPDATTDEPYVLALVRGLSQAIELARADLAIYLAGADPFHDDRLGRLALSKSGLRERDRLVYAACRTSGLPLAISMAGGYARHIEDTVAIQAATVSGASELY